MKTAIDCYSRGKQKEASADEYDRRYSYPSGRFLCPECGELVHLTGSKYSNHFAHYKKSDISAECDRRVDGMPTSSVYERVGLPIYLRKKTSGDFELYMGFKAIPELVLDLAVKDNITLKIDRICSYKVNHERFSCTETTLLPLEYIPMSGQKYSISFDPSNKSERLYQHWSDYADGFSYDGALFTISELGGKKLRHGDSITTDKDYYWVRRQSQLPSYWPGMESSKAGRVILKDSIWNDFKVRFKSDLSDASFTSLTASIRNSLRLHLLEKQPEFIPLWPPLRKAEDGYLASDDTTRVLGYVASGNDIPKMFVYKGINNIPEEEYLVDCIASINMTTIDTMINIDRKYISSGTLISKRRFEDKGHFTAVKKVDEDIVINDTVLNVEGKSLHVFSDIRLEAIIIRKEGSIETHSVENELLIQELELIDTIICVRGKRLLSVIKIQIQDEDKGAVLCADKLIPYLKKYERTKQVDIPIEIRKTLLALKSKVPETNVSINKYLNENKIPLVVIKLLKKEMRGNN